MSGPFTHGFSSVNTRMTNLGLALWKLGEREGGTARLEEAVVAHRAALEEFTPERVPQDWATAQTNLAMALMALGKRESGTARLEESVAAYDLAISIFVSAGIDRYVESCQANRDRAIALIKERKR